MQDKEKKLNRRKLFLAGIVLLLSVTVLATSTYAWYMITRTPYVSDLGLKAVTDGYLQIAPDVNGQPGEWDVIYDMSELLEDAAPLRTVTYSQANNSFYAMSYGLDGRADAADIRLSDEVNNCVVTDSSANANENGYYIAVTFWVRASASADIALSEAREVQEGTSGSGTYVIGNPVWNGEAVQHENGGNGLETALRIGLVCQTTDLECNEIGDPVFYIYEPNCDTHVDGSEGYVATQSIDGTEGLISEDRLITQTTSTWEETTPVLSSEVVYSLGDFDKDLTLFRITAATYQRVVLYVWLEGQDVDCVNSAAAHETSILANIQLKAQEDQDGTGIVRD